MNIFMILLMALFMAGYYLLDAPHVNVGETRAQAMETAELNSVLACMLRAHSDAMKMDEADGIEQKTIVAADLPCAERYGIISQKLCADEKRLVSKCVPDKAAATVSNYVITSSGAITENGAGKILELLGRDYPYAANFGIISIGGDKTPHILSSGGAKREISRAIAKEAKFESGELVYITQYAVSGKKNPAVAKQLQKIRCGRGEIPIFRQNAWQCAASNYVPICSGEYIWDAESESCVADKSRRPLCRSNQAAIMTDGVWECVDPAQKPDCPKGAAAEMNYETLAWECAPAAAAKQSETARKCKKIYADVTGGGTTTLSATLVSCNDCERMIVHDDCAATCVPDAATVSKRACYSGKCDNFYFGFPTEKYAADVRKYMPELADARLPVGDGHSRNRRFNCMKCPRGANALASRPPYVIVCQ